MANAHGLEIDNGAGRHGKDGCERRWNATWKDTNCLPGRMAPNTNEKTWAQRNTTNDVWIKEMGERGIKHPIHHLSFVGQATYGKSLVVGPESECRRHATLR